MKEGRGRYCTGKARCVYTENGGNIETMRERARDGRVKEGKKSGEDREVEE